MLENQRPFFIYGAGGQGTQPEQRTPIEKPEGVTGETVETASGLVKVDRAVSLTKIKVLDLISEGLVEGLVSGYYRYVGTIGNVGYDAAEFVPYTLKTVGGQSIGWLRSVYWNETPVVDKDDLFNFQEVDVQFTNGKPNGSVVGGIVDELTITRTINERLRGPNVRYTTKNGSNKQVIQVLIQAIDGNNVTSDQTREIQRVEVLSSVEQFSKTYRIINRDCKGVNLNIRVNALSETIIKGAKAGDVVQAGVYYRIYYKPLFSTPNATSVENQGPEDQAGYIFAKDENIYGKITYGYIRSTRVDFDGDYSRTPNFIGWSVKVFRLTPDSIQGSLRNQTYIDSLTEIYGQKFCYPNSAIIAQKFSAEYFASIPQRAFDMRLLRVKIPSNYDPVLRRYNGNWDGTWKTESHAEGVGPVTAVAQAASTVNISNVGIEMSYPFEITTSNIDGYLVPNGQLILLKNQTNPVQNGLYQFVLVRIEVKIGVLWTYRWTRSPITLDKMVCSVVHGATNAGKYFLQTTPNPTLEIDSVTFTEVQSSSVSTGSDTSQNEVKVWTDNPVWCFYDLLTNKRYGLGRFIEESTLDKWTLYEIAKYCDVLVSDGQGGLEPRFTCNLILSSREEAYKVLNDMASIFRAIIYYGAGNIYSSQDSEKSPIFHFTNANVEEGNFTYSSSSKRVRHSIAVVRYNDKNNFYRPAVEYVEDVEAIKKYGIREIEVTAFGCTSRGQALRLGRWALISESLETEAVSFTAGLEGAYMRPGDIFAIFDKNKRSVRLGGRTTDINTSSSDVLITLDGPVTGLRASTVYNFSLLTPTFNYDTSLVSGLVSSDTINVRRPQVQTVPFFGSQTQQLSGKTIVSFISSTFGRTFDFENYNKGNNLIWTIEASGTDLQDQGFNEVYDYYRAIRIEERDENKYSINAIQYAGDKFKAIESGLNFETIELTQPLPPPVTSLSLSLATLSPTVKGIDYRLNISNFSGVSSFLVYAKDGPWQTGDFAERFTNGGAATVLDETPDSKYLINILPSTRTSGIFVPINNGRFYFRAYSRNVQGTPCLTPAVNDITIDSINSFQDFGIRSLRLQGYDEDGRFAVRSGVLSTLTNPTFYWQAGFISNSGQISVSNVKYRITFRKPTDPSASNPASISEWPGYYDTYKPSQVIYFEVTGYQPENLTNLNYTFNLEDNIQAFTDYYLSQGTGNQTGILREYDVVVEAHLDDGTSSAGGNFLNGTRGGVRDSDFDNVHKNGWDILFVHNDKVPAVSLTPNSSLSACRIANDSNPNVFCTDQYFTSEGTIKLYADRGNYPNDAVGGYIFTSTKSFTQAEAYSGRKADGTQIKQSPFSEILNPISVDSNLIGTRSGYMSVALFDSLDQAFTQKIQETVPSFSIIPFLNMSNVIGVSSRGVLETQKQQYRAWIAGAYSYNGGASVGEGIMSYISEGIIAVTWNANPVFVNPAKQGVQVKFTFENGRIIVPDYRIVFTKTDGRPATVTDRRFTDYRGYPEENPIRIDNTNQDYVLVTFPLGIWVDGVAANPSYSNKSESYTYKFFLGVVYNEDAVVSLTTLTQ